MKTRSFVGLDVHKATSDSLLAKPLWTVRLLVINRPATARLGCKGLNIVYQPTQTSFG